MRFLFASAISGLVVFFSAMSVATTGKCSVDTCHSEPVSRVLMKVCQEVDIKKVYVSLPSGPCYCLCGDDGLDTSELETNGETVWLDDEQR